jgi:hypothetical protein
MDVHDNEHRRQQTGGEARTDTMNNAGHLRPVVVARRIPRVKQGNRLEQVDSATEAVGLQLQQIALPRNE